MDKTDNLESINSSGRCPDCGSNQFLKGPHAGLALNIKCAGCGSTFWYAPPFDPTRISDGAKYSETPRLLQDM